MDSLDDLPVTDTEATPQETDVVRRLFRAQSDNKPGSQSKRRARATNPVLLTIYLSIVFAVLANPWADTVFSGIPPALHGEKPLVQFAAKTLIFLSVTFILTKWVI